MGVPQKIRSRTTIWSSKSSQVDILSKKKKKEFKLKKNASVWFIYRRYRNNLNVYQWGIDKENVIL